MQAAVGAYSVPSKRYTSQHQLAILHLEMVYNKKSIASLSSYSNTWKRDNAESPHGPISHLQYLLSSPPNRMPCRSPALHIRSSTSSFEALPRKQPRPLPIPSQHSHTAGASLQPYPKVPYIACNRRHVTRLSMPSQPSGLTARASLTFSFCIRSCPSRRHLPSCEWAPPRSRVRRRMGEDRACSTHLSFMLPITDLDPWSDLQMRPVAALGRRERLRFRELFSLVLMHGRLLRGDFGRQARMLLRCDASVHASGSVATQQQACCSCAPQNGRRNAEVP